MFSDVEYALQLNNNGVVATEADIRQAQTNASGLVSIVGGQLLLTNTFPSAIGVNGYGEVDVSSGRVQTVANFLLLGSGKGSLGELLVLGGNFARRRTHGWWWGWKRGLWVSCRWPAGP